MRSKLSADLSAKYAAGADSDRTVDQVGVGGVVQLDGNGHARRVGERRECPSRTSRVSAQLGRGSAILLTSDNRSTCSEIPAHATAPWCESALRGLRLPSGDAYVRRVHPSLGSAEPRARPRQAGCVVSRSIAGGKRPRADSRPLDQVKVQRAGAPGVRGTRIRIRRPALNIRRLAMA